MSDPICEICYISPAIGFLQTYYKDTGDVIEDHIGPNVCEACAETLCDDTDITPIS